MNLWILLNDVLPLGNQSMGRRRLVRRDVTQLGKRKGWFHAAAMFRTALEMWTRRVPETWKKCAFYFLLIIAESQWRTCLRQMRSQYVPFRKTRIGQCVTQFANWFWRAQFARHVAVLIFGAVIWIKSTDKKKNKKKSFFNVASIDLWEPRPHLLVRMVNTIQ